MAQPGVKSKRLTRPLFSGQWLGGGSGGSTASIAVFKFQKFNTEMVDESAESTRIILGNLMAQEA